MDLRDSWAGLCARTSERTSLPTLEEVLACLDRATADAETTGERAVLAGLASDRVAWAVVGGYEAAVAKLIAPTRVARPSFCVSEEKSGAHPRDIATRLTEGRVTGVKSFATLATHADAFVVIASEGRSPDGKNRLRAAILDRDARGIRVEPRPPLPFAPELPHARLVLDDAPVKTLLEGDGYERYVKPFRTVEDAHVILAISAYAFAEGRARGWDVARVEAVARTLLTIADKGDATSAETHLALDAAIDEARAALDGLPWSADDGADDDEAAARWRRDRPILDVAARARAKRAEKAGKADKARRP